MLKVFYQTCTRHSFDKTHSLLNITTNTKTIKSSSTITTTTTTVNLLRRQYHSFYGLNCYFSCKRGKATALHLIKTVEATAGSDGRSFKATATAIAPITTATATGVNNARNLIASSVANATGTALDDVNVTKSLTVHSTQLKCHQQKNETCENFIYISNNAAMTATAATTDLRKIVTSNPETAATSASASAFTSTSSPPNSFNKQSHHLNFKLVCNLRRQLSERSAQYHKQYNYNKSIQYNNNKNKTIEQQLSKSPALLNLVLNNRKLSFYDTNNRPTIDETYRLREQEQRSAEDVLFDMFQNEETGLISMGKFLAALKTTGIHRNDLRVKEMMDNLKKVHKMANYETGSSPETQNLDRKTFNTVVTPNIVLIAKAFRQQFIIPDFAGFIKDIEDIYWKCKSNNSGKVADYIPQLARYNPESWGVSICTIDGQRYSIGDVNVPFTLQSCSKPLTYAIALEKLGAQVVHSYVGQEPSGRNFNELILDYNNKPHNPMINAGAILTCSLLQSLIRPEMTAAEKFDYTMSWFKRLSGGENISFNNAVFLSEREAADRNYALGFYMRENKCYPKGTILKDVMDFYFQCCSMETTCETMSVIAATLANGGICPTTEEKVLQSEVVRDVLSIMHSCGTYDYSGQFAFKVGLPAKSGVSGGMMLVIPNVMGIFTWSPPLDQLGNSGRGLQFCEELVNIFNFHRYDNLKHASNKKDPRKHRYETKGLSIVNLLFSAASGDVTALRRYRLSGMDIRLADYDGRTALHLAASEGHLNCVKFLLEQCHVPHNPKDRWGNRPIDEARNFGQNHIVEYLEAWSEKSDNNEEMYADPIIKNTEADEEIIQNETYASHNHDNLSEADRPRNLNAASDDKTRPGF